MIFDPKQTKPVAEMKKEQHFGKAKADPKQRKYATHKQDRTGSKDYYINYNGFGGEIPAKVFYHLVLPGL